MDRDNIVWKVAGAAGEGIMSTGLLFSKTCARHGWYIFDYTEYPSLIPGGHNTYQVHAAKHPVFSQNLNVDVLAAINKDGLDFHLEELAANSVVLYDGQDDSINISEYRIKGKAIDLPMVELARDVGGKELMGNNVALGASIYLFGLDLNLLEEVISDVFGDKGKEVVDLNKKAASIGFQYMAQKTRPILKVEKQPDVKHLTLTGNEAVCLGALAGGLQFYAAYPMTPSSSVLHYLAACAKKTPTQIVVKHAEDEISAANMACGAAFAGTRAMVGTSGGGFCYMVEALGLCGVAELPVVFFEAMRPGPALGLPTWTAQGDLNFVLSASHGEFPRFVLAPGDAQEAFDIAKKSMELAEKYQTPVILLSDKYLAESRHTFKLDQTVFQNARFGLDFNPQIDDSGFYPRYELTDTGISKRSIPGFGWGPHLANSYTHTKYGLSSEESSDRKNQVDKRFRKMDLMTGEIPPQFWDVDLDAKITFISFGSTKGSLLAAKQILKKDNIPVSILNLSWLWPFPKDQVKKVIESSRNVVVIEGNYLGQLAGLIAQETGVMIKERYHRFDGRPFYPEEIVTFVKNFKA